MKPHAAAARILELARKEFLQTFRDPRMFRLMLVAPILQLVVFGYAVSTDVRDTRTALVDQDATPASRRAVEALTASGYFRIVKRAERPAALVDALEHGRALVGVHIPRGFARDLTRGEAEVQLLVDGTQANTATVALGYAERILLDHGLRVAMPAAQRPVELRDRAWFNPGLESRDYNVPAVIGTILMLICMILTSLAVVREREIGTLEQLMVSPLSSVELMVGKMLPFALVGLADLVLITTVALLWFRVPFAGSPVVLVVATVLYLVPALAIGLLISTVSSTQQEAFMTSFLFMMPIILLSGFAFPVASMPGVFQVLTLLNPQRHFIEIVRAVFLKGAGLDVLWPQFAALVALGAVLLGLAATRFHKTVA